MARTRERSLFECYLLGHIVHQVDVDGLRVHVLESGHGYRLLILSGGCGGTLIDQTISHSLESARRMPVFVGALRDQLLDGDGAAGGYAFARHGYAFARHRAVTCRGSVIRLSARAGEPLYATDDRRPGRLGVP